MNYEDEDFVRYFTRDTVSWRALEWEGQTVLALMLHGKFDRSGVFDCDGHDPSHAVTLVTGMPREVAEVGLARLLKAGTWVHQDGRLVWPKFLHAQSCRRSDRARQRESRENRRSDALATITESRDQTSPPVTARHTESQPVTLSLAELSLDPPKPPLAKTGARRRRTVAPETTIPDDFSPSPAHRAFAALHGLDLALELAGFVGWAQGRTQVSWNGSFTTRLANSAKWRGERGSRVPGGQNAPTPAPTPAETLARRASAKAAVARAEAQRDADLAGVQKLATTQSDAAAGAT